MNNKHQELILELINEYPPTETYEYPMILIPAKDLQSLLTQALDKTPPNKV